MDKKEYGPYVLIGLPFFSPDGEHVAFMVTQDKDKKKWSIVVDGVVGKKQVQGLTDVPIIFDSPNTFHTLALKNSEKDILRFEGKIN